MPMVLYVLMDLGNPSIKLSYDSVMMKNYQLQCKGNYGILFIIKQL